MIEHKSKPCKGTGQAKGIGCGKPTKHRVYGLGKMCGCYTYWLLNTDAGKIKLEKATLKATKTRKDLEQAFSDKKNRDKITTLIKSVVDTCHKYIRERDKGKPCIACGTPWKSDFQASHFFKAELYSTLKLNEYNIHAGCIDCNLNKEGNITEYVINLPLRIGKDKFDELNYLATLDKHNKTFKWDRETLKSIRKYYQDKIKELI